MSHDIWRVNVGKYVDDALSWLGKLCIFRALYFTIAVSASIEIIQTKVFPTGITLHFTRKRGARSKKGSVPRQEITNL